MLEQVCTQLVIGEEFGEPRIKQEQPTAVDSLLEPQNDAIPAAEAVVAASRSLLL